MLYLGKQTKWLVRRQHSIQETPLSSSRLIEVFREFIEFLQANAVHPIGAIRSLDTGAHRKTMRCSVHCEASEPHCAEPGKNSMAWVRKRTIPTEGLPLVGEDSDNFLRIEGATWSEQRIPTAVIWAF
jgi:hypothetical protein